MNNFKLIKTDLERINENKKMFIIINIVFFVLLFIANYMTPLMGDDLVYMNVLDSNVPTKISSFKDALHNTIFLYRIWSGRILPNLFNFTFFIFNKNVFNLFNSLIYVILSLVIYIYIYGRKAKINNSYLLLIYSLIWFYLPDKVDVYLWQTGSLNYFSNVLLCLLWFIPYYTYSICNKKINYTQKYLFNIFYFVFSFIVGLSHEAHDGAMLFAIILCFIIQKLYYSKNIKVWQVLGLVGLLSGTIIVLRSPGNAIRAKDLWLWGNNIFIDRIFTFARILLFTLALKPIYLITITTVFYICIKKNNIKNLLNKKLAPNLFFVIFYLGSIFEYMLVSGRGYHARCLTLTSFICIIYMMYAIHNCLFDKNKKFFICLSIVLSLQVVYDMIHTAYKMTGLILFR